MVQQERAATDNSLELYLQELNERGYEPRLRGANGTCRFDVEGGPGYSIRVENGSVALIDAPAEADCVISASPEVFDRLARGELNARVALLRNDAHMSGDLPLAARVGRYLFFIRPWVQPEG